MKKVLNQYLEEKTDLERVINREKQRSTRMKLSREKNSSRVQTAAWASTRM
uniref:Uncharacterized protein n=1 Tax=Arundo donax TaxID=35708 RepID=A0A0A9DK28_ARUDO